MTATQQGRCAAALVRANGSTGATGLLFKQAVNAASQPFTFRSPLQRSRQHLQAHLNEFTFRFNRRFYPSNAFRSLLGIAGDVTAPTYAELYAVKSRPCASVKTG
jgi:hypothetical protein